MTNNFEYKTQYCKVHKKTIHFFPVGKIENESQCWDCWREANKKKFREEQERKRAQERFSIDFSHLWITNLLGGISSTFITKDGLHVCIRHSQEAFEQVPDIYLNYRVHKEIVGAAA